MLQVKLPVNRIQPQSHKFAMGVQSKATGVFKVNERPALGLVFNNSWIMCTECPLIPRSPLFDQQLIVVLINTIKISIDSRPTLGWHLINIFIATQSSVSWCIAECWLARMHRSTLCGMFGKICQLLTNRVSITGVYSITGSEFGKSFLIWATFSKSAGHLNKPPPLDVWPFPSSRKIHVLYIMIMMKLMVCHLPSDRVQKK